MNSFARTQIETRVKALEETLHAAAKDPSDPDAIHDLRVTIRRLNAGLKAFALVLDTTRVEKIRKSIRKILHRCAAVRNCDIALELLHETGITEHSRTIHDVKAERRDAIHGLSKHLARWKHKNIAQSWPDQLLRPKVPDIDVRPDLAALAQDFADHGQSATAPRSDYYTLHQFRLAAKKYRYTLEIFEPLLNRRATERLLGRLKELQDGLGEINDCVSALELVAGHRKSEKALRDLLHAREQAFRLQWHDTFANKETTQWTSTFSATAKPTRVRRKRPMPVVSSPRKASKKSAASSSAHKVPA